MTNTRQRIQQVALELFTEQGYEKTSLREIAERLDVTKAALYYHFKTKEDILGSYIEDFRGAIDALVEWGREHRGEAGFRVELLRQYMDAIAERHQMLRFFHENQPTIRRMEKGDEFKKRMGAMLELLVEPDAQLTTRVRAFQALMTTHMTWFVFFEDGKTSVDEIRSAALTVAEELLSLNEVREAMDPALDELARDVTTAAGDLTSRD